MACTTVPANQLPSTENGAHDVLESSTGLEYQTSAPSKAGDSHPHSDDLEPDVDNLPNKKARLHATAADADAKRQPCGPDADTAADPASNSAAGDNPAVDVSNDAGVAAAGTQLRINQRNRG